MEISDLPTELIDKLPISISVRKNEIILYANHMCVKLAGLNQLYELLGFDATKSIHPCDIEHVKKSKKETPNTPFRYRALNMQGETIFLETTIFHAEWEGDLVDIYLSRNISNEVIHQQDLEKIRDQLLMLHTHINELEKTDSIKSIIRVTYEALTKTLGYDILDICKVEDDYLYDIVNPEPTFRFKLDEPCILTRAVHTGETQFIVDTSLDPDYVTGGRDNVMRSELTIPVKLNGLVRYLLNVENKLPHAFGAIDKQIVESMALHMSHALTRVNDKQRHEQYIIRLENLHRFLVKANNLYTIDEVTKNIFSTLTNVLDGITCSLGIIKGDEIHFNYYNTSDRSDIYPLDGPGITVRAAKTGTVQHIPDVSKDPDYINQYGDPIRSELAVPVKIRGTTVAVLNVESPEIDAFTPEDRNLVMIMAEHTASSLERIQYVEQVEKVERDRSKENIDGLQRVTSMVNHDIKGPLSVIRNSVFLLKTGADPKRILELIDESVVRINEIIDDLGELTVSGNLVRVAGDFNSMLKETVAGLVHPENISVELNIEPKVLFLNFDASKFKRVITNLSLNAFQAMPNGGELSIDLNVDNGKIVLSFKDTGVGIDSENLSNVFNPYYTTKSGGMGLGLVICKQIVEAHNGSIQVESKLGRGTIFKVLIPT